jgi:hypothetical protein
LPSLDHPSIIPDLKRHLNAATRAACSSMTRALSSVSVPVGSP